MVDTETAQPAKRQCLSLRDSCWKTLGDTDIAHIPPHLMAELLVEQRSKLQAVQMQLKDAVTELNHIKMNSYKVQPLNDGVESAPLMERVDAVYDLWRDSTENSPGRSGLIQVPLDTITINSALALYRV